MKDTAWIEYQSGHCFPPHKAFGFRTNYEFIKKSTTPLALQPFFYFSTVKDGRLQEKDDSFGHNRLFAL